MKNMYCSNCKYFSKAKYFFLDNNCYAPENIELKSNFYKRFKHQINSPQELNGYNKCHYYKQSFLSKLVEFFHG
jgi:hypothetical protein